MSEPLRVTPGAAVPCTVGGLLSLLDRMVRERNLDVSTPVKAAHLRFVAEAELAAFPPEEREACPRLDGKPVAFDTTDLSGVLFLGGDVLLVYRNDVGNDLEAALRALRGPA
jgi:hypothetical protein